MRVGIAKLKLIDSHGRIIVGMGICELGVYLAREAENSHGKTDKQQALAHDSNLADPMIGREQRRSEDHPN